MSIPSPSLVPAEPQFLDLSKLDDPTTADLRNLGEHDEWRVGMIVAISLGAGHYLRGRITRVIDRDNSDALLPDREPDWDMHVLLTSGRIVKLSQTFCHAEDPAGDDLVRVVKE